jgi:hypothetical protein
MTDTATRSRPGAQIDTTIDYLLPTSRINRRFWAPGKEFNTGLYQPYPVTIRNARLAERPFTLDDHGFCIAPHTSGVQDFADPAQLATYPQEVAEVAKMLTGCDYVFCMSGQLRSR